MSTGWKSRKEYFESVEGRIRSFQLRKQDRFSIVIDSVEPQSKNMSDVDKDRFQREVIEQMDELDQPTYRGPIALRMGLATTSKNAPQAHTIAKNFLDLLSESRSTVSTERKRLLYNDDRQIQILSVSCHHGETHPHISINSRRFSSALKDLELAVEAIRANDDRHERYLNDRMEEEWIDNYRELIVEEEQRRAKLGDQLYEAWRKMTRWSAQRALLRKSGIGLMHLAWLYQLPKNSVATALYQQWTKWFSESPLRITIGALPQIPGSSNAFRDQIDAEITKFRKKFDWVLRPLVVPVALEVIVRPAPNVPKAVLHDLDNVVRDYLLPKFVPAFGTVTDHRWTIDFDELEKRDPELRANWGDSPTPPKSTRDGVIRYEAWRLPQPTNPKSKGFVSVALVADEGLNRDLLAQIDGAVDDWEKSLEQAGDDPGRRLYRRR